MDDQRSEAVNEVIRKGAALLVGMAVVIAGGTWLLVHALGLNGAGEGKPAVTIQPASPLPTVALSVPGQASGAPSSGPSSGPSDGSSSASATASPSHRPKRQLRLSATPLEVNAMDRINLTGTYGNRDNVSLQVQRWENGTWGDFPIEVTVSVGTFATYVQTSQVGVNRFRVFDPAAGIASNVVRITVR